MLEISLGQFPILHTPRLILREISPDDAAAVFAMRSDPEVMRYIGKLPQKDLREAEEMIQDYLQTYSKDEAINWAICYAEKPELMLGTMGFWRFDKVNHRAEIGYTLAAAHWRKGIMSEAMQVAIEYCFKNLGFHSIEANTDPENDASGLILEKHGFLQEAYFRENFYFDGKFLDSRIYSKVNPHHT